MAGLFLGVLKGLRQGYDHKGKHNVYGPNAYVTNGDHWHKGFLPRGVKGTQYSFNPRSGEYVKRHSKGQ